MDAFARNIREPLLREWMAQTGGKFAGVLCDGARHLYVPLAAGLRECCAGLTRADPIRRVLETIQQFSPQQFGARWPAPTNLRRVPPGSYRHLNRRCYRSLCGFLAAKTPAPSLLGPSRTCVGVRESDVPRRMR